MTLWDFIFQHIFDKSEYILCYCSFKKKEEEVISNMFFFFSFL